MLDLAGNPKTSFLGIYDIYELVLETKHSFQLFRYCQIYKEVLFVIICVATFEKTVYLCGL